MCLQRAFLSIAFTGIRTSYIAQERPTTYNAHLFSASVHASEIPRVQSLPVKLGRPPAQSPPQQTAHARGLSFLPSTARVPIRPYDAQPSHQRQDSHGYHFCNRYLERRYRRFYDHYLPTSLLTFPYPRLAARRESDDNTVP